MSHLRFLIPGMRIIALGENKDHHQGVSETGQWIQTFSIQVAFESLFSKTSCQRFRNTLKKSLLPFVPQNLFWYELLKFSDYKAQQRNIMDAESYMYCQLSLAQFSNKIDKLDAMAPIKAET